MGPDAFCDVARVRFVAARQHDGELVTAEATDEVVGAHGVGAPTGHLGEHSVSRRMSIGVVDLFEVVDVEHQHPGNPVCVRDSFDAPPAPFQELTPIVETGEVVGPGDHAERGARSLSVSEGGHESHHDDGSDASSRQQDEETVGAGQSVERADDRAAEERDTEEDDAGGLETPVRGGLTVGQLGGALMAGGEGDQEIGERVGVVEPRADRMIRGRFDEHDHVDCHVRDESGKHHRRWHTSLARGEQEPGECREQYDIG